MASMEEYYGIIPVSYTHLDVYKRQDISGKRKLNPIETLHGPIAQPVRAHA